MLKTGFSFIDKDAGGIQEDSAVMIGGNASQIPDMMISLMQGILQNNDGYVIILDVLNLHHFTTSIFDVHSDDDYIILAQRFIKNRVVKRNRMYLSLGIDWKNNFEIWKSMKKYSHLRDKKLLAVFCAEPRADTSTIKEFIKNLHIPLIYMGIGSCGYFLPNPPQNIDDNDMCLWFEAVNGYLEPITIKTMTFSKQVITEVNGTSKLRYAEHLKDCENMWFY